MIINMNRSINVCVHKDIINKLLILSESLDRTDILARAISSLLCILEYYQDDYTLFYVPDENSKKKFLFLALPVCVNIALHRPVACGDDSTIYNVVLASNWRRLQSVRSMKKYLSSSFHLNVVSDQFLMNLALIVHKNNLEALAKGEYSVYMFSNNDFSKPSIHLCFNKNI